MFIGEPNQVDAGEEFTIISHPDMHFSLTSPDSSKIVANISAAGGQLSDSSPPYSPWSGLGGIMSWIECEEAQAGESECTFAYYEIPNSTFVMPHATRVNLDHNLSLTGTVYIGNDGATGTNYYKGELFVVFVSNDPQCHNNLSTLLKFQPGEFPECQSGGGSCGCGTG